MVVQRRSDNSGRWGSDDELGALNLIDPAKRRLAAHGVNEGRMYSLAIRLNGDTPRTRSRNPISHSLHIARDRERDRGVADDLLSFNSHSGTHLDALCHYWGAEGLYNGFSHEEIQSKGAPALAIHNVPGIVTRGLVVDVSGSCPIGEAGWGHEVTPDDIDRELAQAGLVIEPGDAVLLRTGWEALSRENPETYAWGEPGIGRRGAEWLGELDVALVGADNWGLEAVPTAHRGEGMVAHRTLLNDYGIYILENLTLRAVAEAEGTCSGLLMIAPLPIEGGTGSPVNPLFVR